MSDTDDAETVVDAAEDADPEDAKHDDADEQPDADELPSPDLPEPDPEDIEDDESDDEGDDSTDESDGDTDDGEDTPTPRQAAQDTMGDLYAKMLVNVTNTIIDEHGKEGAEPVDIEAARQADVGHHFDRLMDEMGMGRDLPPGQAVVLSSTFFLGSNIAAKTDVPAQAMSELDF